LVIKRLRNYLAFAPARINQVDAKQIMNRNASVIWKGIARKTTIGRSFILPSCAPAKIRSFLLIFSLFWLAGTVTAISPQKEVYGYTASGVALTWIVGEPDVEPAPAVLVVHAGGFKTGVPGPLDVVQDLANAGFLALAAEYPLAPPHEPMNHPPHSSPGQNEVNDDGYYPEQTDALRMAVRDARADARCDGKVYWVGGSAGASHGFFLAATETAGDAMPDLVVGLSGPYDFANLQHLEDTCIPGQTCFWKGVINYLGIPDYINHLPELAAASPITYVNNGMPPVFLMVSSNDASGLGDYDFPEMIAALDNVGFTESRGAYPAIGHYKQWIVPVTEVEHAFDYWDQVKDNAILWLQAGI
jgi:acetyl esterase/lipase